MLAVFIKFSVNIKWKYITWKCSLERDTHKTSIFPIFWFPFLPLGVWFLFKNHNKFLFYSVFSNFSTFSFNWKSFKTKSLLLWLLHFYIPYFLMPPAHYEVKETKKSGEGGGVNIFSFMDFIGKFLHFYYISVFTLFQGLKTGQEQTLSPMQPYLKKF